jgi:flavin-dependent dehydrogenase
VSGDVPLFYLIERGPGPRTVDRVLLQQATELGVDVRFQSRVDRVDGPAILATGPKAADAIAVGYHFSTGLDDGFWVILDDELAPGGYAYLLTWNGRGTLKSCMFSGFKEEKRYVERTVEAFERLVALNMRDPKPHGGFGHFRSPRSARSGNNLLVGELAGFQDTLWGFGIRLAITSGVLAAGSLAGGTEYDAAWRRELGPQMEASVVNRALFSVLGNRGYGWFLSRLASRDDPRELLRRHYRHSTLKRLLAPWAKRRFRSRRQDASCDHVDCHCAWCRHGEHGEPEEG